MHRASLPGIGQSLQSENTFYTFDECYISPVPPRLTSTNLVLLVLGILLSCSAIAGVCVILIVVKLKAITGIITIYDHSVNIIHNYCLLVSKVSFILLPFGAVVSVVLCMAVGFYVGLQHSEFITCSSSRSYSADFFRHV